VHEGVGEDSGHESFTFRAELEKLQAPRGKCEM
jgi:hypothetical protein